MSHLITEGDDEHMLICHAFDRVTRGEGWSFSHNDVSTVVDWSQFTVHVNVFDGRTPIVVGCGHRSNLQGSMLIIFGNPVRLCLIVKLGQHLWMSMRKNFRLGMDIDRRHVRLNDLPVLAIAIAVAVSASASASLARV